VNYLTTKQLREKENLWRMIANKKTGSAHADAIQKVREYRDMINERENEKTEKVVSNQMR
jgi:hypothetical protein